MKRKTWQRACSVFLCVLLFCSGSFVVNAENSDVPIGTKITLGSYNGEPISWVCVLNDDSGPLFLSEKVLCKKEFDAAGESAEYHTDGWGYIRKQYGSSCWEDSNIREWLNSSGRVNYTHCHPSYEEENGFLTGFTTEELYAIKEVVHQVNVNIWENRREGYCEGGKSDRFNPFTEPFDYSELYHKKVSDKVMLLDYIQINRIWNENKNFLLSDESYFLGCVGGNDYACFEHVYTTNGNSCNSTTRAYTQNGIRPAIYVDIDAFNAISSKTYTSGFVFGVDNIGYSNIDQGDYNISSAGMTYLLPMIYKDYIFAVSQLVSRKSEYTGACYGFAKLNSSFFNGMSTKEFGAATPYEIKSDNQKAHDAINILYFSQGSVISAVKAVRDAFNFKNYSQKNMRKKAVDIARNVKADSYLPVLSIHIIDEEKNHSVNIIGILPDDFDKDCYVVETNDCNDIEREKRLIVSKDFSLAGYGNETDGYKNVTINNISIPFYDEIDDLAPLLRLDPLNLYSTDSITDGRQSMRLQSSPVAVDSKTENLNENQDNAAIKEKYIQFLVNSTASMVISDRKNGKIRIENGEIKECSIEDIIIGSIGSDLIRIVCPYNEGGYQIDSTTDCELWIMANGTNSSVISDSSGTVTYDRQDGVSFSPDRQSSTEISFYKDNLMKNEDIAGISVSANGTGRIEMKSDSDSVNVRCPSDELVKMEAQYSDTDMTREEIAVDKSISFDGLYLSAENSDIDVEYEAKEICSDGHRDSDGDGICDNCNDDISEGISKCTHICHSNSSFLKFIWKLFRFLCKVFGINKYCVCGAKHY